MADFKPNSFASREAEKNKAEERPKLEKVVTGNVNVVKKKSFGAFLAKIFGSEESDIGTHITQDLLIPTIRDIIIDTVTMAVGGKPGSRGGASRIIGDRVSYGSYYNSQSAPRRPQVVTTTAFNTDELVFRDRGDAEHILDRLFEIRERYGVVRVTDLYDMAGVTVDYTADKYGWMDLRNTRIGRVRDGYIIELPRPVPID